MPCYDSRSDPGSRDFSYRAYGFERADTVGEPLPVRKVQLKWFPKGKK